MEKVKYKCVFIIMDGLGDSPVAAFAGRTPLESAFTPHFDRLAAEGLYGQAYSLQRRIAPSENSSTAMFLGLAPEDERRLKRGPVEAAGAGLLLHEGDIALRVNFAAVNPAFNSFVVTNRRAWRLDEPPELLAAELDQMDLGDGVCATFRATGQHRAVLVLSGAGLDDCVSDTDPGEDELPAPVLTCHALVPLAHKTAEKINAFVKLAHSRLRSHPINTARVTAGELPTNAIITRGAGSPLELGNVIQQLGLRAAVISGCNTIRGLGRMFGFTVISDPRFTATIKTDLSLKIQTAITALQQHDIVFVHIKAADVCATNRQPEAKKEFIERLDASLMPILNHPLVTAITADRATDSNTGRRSTDSLPALIHSPERGIGLLGVNFGEEACRNGTMSRQAGKAFLQRVLTEMGAHQAR